MHQLTFPPHHEREASGGSWVILLGQDKCRTCGTYLVHTLSIASADGTKRVFPVHYKGNFRALWI